MSPKISNEPSDEGSFYLRDFQQILQHSHRRQAMKYLRDYSLFRREVKKPWYFQVWEGKKRIARTVMLPIFQATDSCCCARNSRGLRYPND